MERREQDDDEERQQSGASDRLIRRIVTSGDGGAVSHGDPVFWPTVDGPLGLSEERSLEYARSFFRWGFFLLPFLWAVNCFYFWPVLRSRSPSSSFQRIRPYVVGSAIGFLIFTVLLSSWALTFAIGGVRLFGPVWEGLVMYNVADKFGLTGWT
ncbi:probable gamma-secretase subunit PEN-2 [Phalaenopsis equestris]|uniref:probable gamma-secretase subunit PEN-2 n=1 Tax=Phalaenopsis equestris TaxID=78828 RepID=UPI0009E23FC7|nr:probable gamma-secretase subunit PEN-2 [Phalaenopsis equestris]